MLKAEGAMEAWLCWCASARSASAGIMRALFSFSPVGLVAATRPALSALWQDPISNLPGEERHGGFRIILGGAFGILSNASPRIRGRIPADALLASQLSASH
jgi:hypothetical protein